MAAAVVPPKRGPRGYLAATSVGSSAALGVRLGGKDSVAVAFAVRLVSDQVAYALYGRVFQRGTRFLVDTEGDEA
jgi:hypothetical protein